MPYYETDGEDVKKYLPEGLEEVVEVFDRVFGDDPIDEVENITSIDDQESRLADKLLHAIIDAQKNPNPTIAELKLKPYLRMPYDKYASTPKQSLGRRFLNWVRLKWLESVFRLVVWRLLFFMLVATMWFLVLVYREKARTIIPNVTAMYTSLIFLTSFLISGYFERVLDRFRDAKLAFQNSLKSIVNFGLSFASFISNADERVGLEAAKNLDRNKVKGWTPLDAVVHLQYLCHALPFAQLQEVRNKLDYDSLPLFPYQIKILREENGIRIDRIEPIYGMIRRSLVELEVQGLLMRNIDARTLSAYLDKMQENMTEMEESVSNSIPSGCIKLLNLAVFVFCFFLGPLIWDEDGWAWSYLFYAIPVYIIYGFMRQSGETRNPLQDNNASTKLHAPVEKWALINCAEVDRCFENAIAYLRRNKIAVDTHFPLTAKGAVDVMALGDSGPNRLRRIKQNEQTLEDAIPLEDVKRKQPLNF